MKLIWNYTLLVAVSGLASVAVAAEPADGRAARKAGPNQTISTRNQETSGNAAGRYVITGYGDVLYTDYTNKKNNETFQARFIPIFLFKLSDKLHVEAETEITVGEAGGTELALEYANIHYFISPTTTVTAGRFLLPFAQMGPNLHPSWINRLPVTPSLYQSHGGGSPVTGILPILSDFGVAAQQIIPFSSRHKLFFNAYIVNGPRKESPEAGHTEAAPDYVSEKRQAQWGTELEFEASTKDNNRKKATGGRIAYVWLPMFELGASYYQGVWNDRDDRNWLEILNQNYTSYTREDRYFRAGAVDLALIGEHWRLRGEYVRTVTDVVQPQPKYTGEPLPAQRASGYYAEASLQLAVLGIPALAPFEVVGRYDSVTRYNYEKRVYYGVDSGATKFNDRIEEQAVYGLNYWLNETAVIKVAYEDNKLPYKSDQKLSGRDYDRILAQFAYGF